MATNKVVYGNTTLIDLTGDTAEASDVASGKIFHNKAGVQQTGTATIVTPTSITPSNSSPASMSANGIYKPTASGYAVASNPISLAPSNSSPPSITDNEIYKTSGNGYAIQSYGNVTPSANGTYFASGFRKMSSSGYAYSSQPSGGVTLDDLNITNKTLFKNVTLDKNKTEEFTTTQDLLVVGTMHGYNNNYKTTFYIDNIEFLSTKASNNTAFVIPSPYGILIPKNHTIKIVTANYSACALNFYIK